MIAKTYYGFQFYPSVGLQHLPVHHFWRCWDIDDTDRGMTVEAVTPKVLDSQSIPSPSFDRFRLGRREHQRSEAGQ